MKFRVIDDRERCLKPIRPCCLYNVVSQQHCNAIIISNLMAKDLCRAAAYSNNNIVKLPDNVDVL